MKDFKFTKRRLPSVNYFGGRCFLKTCSIFFKLSGSKPSSFECRNDLWKIGLIQCPSYSAHVLDQGWFLPSHSSFVNTQVSSLSLSCDIDCTFCVISSNHQHMVGEFLPCLSYKWALMQTPCPMVTCHPQNTSQHHSWPAVPNSTAYMPSPSSSPACPFLSSGYVCAASFSSSCQHPAAGWVNRRGPPKQVSLRPA